jgi:hypothetical protein
MSNAVSRRGCAAGSHRLKVILAASAQGLEWVLRAAGTGWHRTHFFGILGVRNSPRQQSFSAITSCAARAAHRVARRGYIFELINVHFEEPRLKSRLNCPFPARLATGDFSRPGWTRPIQPQLPVPDDRNGRARGEGVFSSG